MLSATGQPSWPDDLHGRVVELVDGYREHLLGCLEGLSEDEARASLVPSRTTLLGLVKHVTYVEGVWFDQAVHGGTPRSVGIAASPDASFRLRADDTVASVGAAYRERIARSREVLAALHPGDVVQGRGERAVWALQLQVLRELAQHSGHADILREQVLAARAG